MTSLLTTNTSDRPTFPFLLEDLLYWVIRKKDGSVIKYSVNDTAQPSSYFPGHSRNLGTHIHTPSTRMWCTHNPEKEPVWVGSGCDLYIADSVGTKNHYDEFNCIIDCGDTLALTGDGFLPSTLINKALRGSDMFVDELETFLTVPPKAETQVLKIHWIDREAPPVTPAFWPKLTELLYGTVLCSCQGGHGRSGTSLVCLMLVLNPEYSPKDAIIHLRALHCARAIESSVQHDYINLVGAFLNRPTNAHEVKNIKDYKKAFLALTLKSAQPYQDRLEKA